jgi:hypothetical protein
MVNLVGDLVEGQHEAREQAEVRAAAAFGRTDKSPADFFGKDFVDKIATLAGVDDDEDLTELWHDIAHNGHHKVHLSLQRVLERLARRDDALDQLPVVTPQLAKLFETGHFAGDNTNMLDEELHMLNLKLRD